MTEPVLKVLFSLTDDKIDAVRLKTNQLIVEIIAKTPKDWCDQFVIPKIANLKETSSYIKKQNILDLIEVIILINRKQLLLCPIKLSKNIITTLYLPF